MYEISLRANGGFTKPVIHHYFDKLDILLNEMKFLLSNFDLNDYPDIRNTVFDFLSLSREGDVRETLYSYEKIGSGPNLVKDDLVEIIKQHPQCPDFEINQYVLGVVPTIILYKTLKLQIQQIKQLEDIFEKLTASFLVEKNIV